MEEKAPLIDRVIRYFSPGAAVRRSQERAVLDSMPAIEAVYRGQLPTRIATPWNTSIGFQGANNPLNRWRLTKMRDRSRDLERNNAIACGLLDRCVDNVIGPHGIRAVPQTGDSDFDKLVTEKWERWTEVCDIRGYCSFAEMQRLTLRGHLRDGDAGIAFVKAGGDVKLQGVPGDQIDTQYGQIPDPSVLDGIRFDNKGRPTQFSIIGYDLMGQRSQSWVSANDFVFFPRLRYTTQYRGEPAFSQIFNLLDQIDGYLEAIVVASRVAACQSLLVKTTDASKIFGGLQTTINSQNQTQPIVNFEPGMVRYLKPGEDVVQIKPEQPHADFVNFLTELLRIAGVTFGMPLELVLLDFSRTNYSSARASLLQAYRSFQTLQQQFIDTVLKRIYRWRISRWVATGELEVPTALRGNPAKGQPPTYWKHTWIAPGWAWVDPVKEIQAAMLEVDLGITSLTDIAAQHGKILTEIFQRRSNELIEQRKLDIPVIHSSLTRDDAEMLEELKPPSPPPPAFDQDGNPVTPPGKRVGGQPPPKPGTPPAKQPGKQPAKQPGKKTQPGDTTPQE